MVMISLYSNRTLTKTVVLSSVGQTTQQVTAGFISQAGVRLRFAESSSGSECFLSRFISVLGIAQLLTLRDSMHVCSGGWLRVACISQSELDSIRCQHRLAGCPLQSFSFLCPPPLVPT